MPDPAIPWKPREAVHTYGVAAFYDLPNAFIEKELEIVELAGNEAAG